MAVRYIRNQIGSINQPNFNNKPEKVDINSQPLNYAQNPIPIIDLYLNKNKFSNDLNDDCYPRIPFKRDLITSKDNIAKYENVEEAEIDAYLLLMGIRTGIYFDIINFFRDYDSCNNYPLIQALFYCGTRSPSTSLISMEAFRILNVVFNGLHSKYEDNIKSWKNTEKEKCQFNFYNDYADDMIFDPNCLTYKMIHALPIFWNHRYNIDEYKFSEEEKEKVDVNDYYNDDKNEHFRERKQGETALEILQPCLLCEQPISSLLINQYLCIFMQLAHERKSLNSKTPMNEKYIDCMIEIDGILLDFYQHHFDFGSKITDVTLSSLITNYIITPLYPFNKYYLNDENEKRRANLNGFLVDFILKFTNMETNNFFLVNSQITKMNSLKCFTSINLFPFFQYKNESFGNLAENEIFCIKDDLNEEITNEIPEQEHKLDDDIEHLKEEKSHLQNELENKNKKIVNLEKVLSLTKAKNNEYNFISTEEEQNFHIDKGQIGSGGTSLTYKIFDKRTKNLMCKKVLKYKEGQTDVKDVQNALKEFEILNSISHPCICKVIGINLEETIEIGKEEIKTVAIFLEFVEYKLLDVLKMNISNTTKVKIVLDIVHAMNFLHKHGMMHRDLKIENIMMNAFFETKLVDFGLAKICESVINGYSFEQDSLTRGIGTFLYMSPEMLNEEKYDNKTDVYSFGIVLHYIFTGNLLKQSLKDRLNGTPINLPPPSKSISKFCIKLIEVCLSHKPTKRPSFEKILSLLRKKSYELASDVDSSILAKHDSELDFLENYT